MTGRRIIGALVVLALAGTTARADPQTAQVGDVRVELSVDDKAELGTIVGFAPDGAELWRIEHRGRYMSFIEPVVVGDRLVASDRGDLLVIDVHAGRVVARYRMPSDIEAMSAAGDQLTLTLEDELVSTPRHTTFDVHYRLGDPTPGRGLFFGLTPFTNERRAHHVHDGYGPIADLSTSDLTAALAQYDEALSRDPTNPYFQYYRGLLLAQLDRPTEADDAFRAAIQTEGAQWSDLVRLAERLELDGRSDDAARAFERGYALMIASGVRPELQQTVLNHMTLGFREVRQSMHAAIADGDVARAQAVLERRWRLMPKVEGGEMFWRVFAGWLREHGETDAADVWEQRGELAEDGWVNRLEMDGDFAERVWVPLMLGMLLAIPLAAFLLGVRVVRSERRTVSLLAGALLVGLPIIAAATFAGKATQLRDIWSMPIADDASFGSPSFVSYLEEQPPSGARDEVLHWARAESAALLAGGRYDGPVPDDATIAAALKPASDVSDTVGGASTLLHKYGSDLDIVALDDRAPGEVDSFWVWDTPLEYALVLLLPLLLGLAVGRFLPKVASATEWILPGGARAFSIASGLLIGLFATGVLVSIGYFEEYWSAGSWPKYFGFEAIWRDVGASPSSTWAYIALAAVPLLQVAMLIVVRRSRSAE